MRHIELLSWEDAGFRATTLGMQFVPGTKPSLENFTFYADLLKDVRAGLMWILGDLLNEAERRFGEDYAQLAEATGYDVSTLYNAKYVASRIDFSRRREELPFSHHQAVAHLEPAEQDRWLVQAEDEEWTRAELRHRVDEEHVRKQPEWSEEPEPTWDEVVESDRPGKAKARELLSMLLEDFGMVEEYLQGDERSTEALRVIRSMILDLIAELVAEVA